MAKPTGNYKRKTGYRRQSRGFLAAGNLIGSQMRTNAAKRAFATEKLRVSWPEIVGAEIAAICLPVQLTLTRGPAGGLLRLAVVGAMAPQIQMMVPTIRERVNTSFGSNTVGRIQLVHATAADLALMPRPEDGGKKAEPDVEIPNDFDETLSSISDGDLREALLTLTRNVLSRSN